MASSAADRSAARSSGAPASAWSSPAVISRSVPANWLIAVSRWTRGSRPPATARAAASACGTDASRAATLRSRLPSGAKSRASSR